MMGNRAENPYPVLLPESLVLGHLVAAMGVFIKATAWEIGERFNKVLSQAHGSDWLIALYGHHHTPNMHDPDFVFNWHPPESELWLALPPFNPDLQGRFGRARWTRNRWEHQAALQSMNSFLTGIDHIARLAGSLELETTEYAHQLRERTRLLQVAGGVLPPSQTELALEHQKEVAEEAKAAAQEALAIAAAAVSAEQVQGALAAEAARQKNDALARVKAAEAEIHRLESELRAAGKLSRQSQTELADKLQPGDAWGDIPLGARILTLKASMVDLMDKATQTLLSQQIGSLAIEASRRWLIIMPNGGQVHLTPAGHAAGVVGGRYLYLGRLDDAIDHRGS